MAAPPGGPAVGCPRSFVEDRGGSPLPRASQALPFPAAAGTAVSARPRGRRLGGGERVRSPTP
ncbi:MAG TPA: hypothetical protein VJT32_12905, partial [bacterium]|nr:hypothetical protein [bacterium]